MFKKVIKIKNKELTNRNSLSSRINVNESINEANNKTSQSVWVASEDMQAATIFTLNSNKDLSKLDGQKVVDLVSDSVDEEPGTFKYIKTIKKDGITIIKAQNRETSNYDYIIFGEDLHYNEKDVDKLVDIVRDLLDFNLHKEEFIVPSFINKGFKKQKQPVWVIVEETFSDSEGSVSAAVLLLDTGEDLSKLKGKELVELVNHHSGDEVYDYKYITSYKVDGLTIVKAMHKQPLYYEYFVFGKGLSYNKEDIDKIIKATKDILKFRLDRKDFSLSSIINGDTNMDNDFDYKSALDGYSDFRENYDNWQVIKEKNKKLTDEDREKLTKRIDYLEELAMDENADSEDMDDYYKEALYLYRILTLADPAWFQ